MPNNKSNIYSTSVKNGKGAADLIWFKFKFKSKWNEIRIEHEFNHNKLEPVGKSRPDSFTYATVLCCYTFV